MPEDIEPRGGLRIAELSFGGWRVVTSAWLIAILFVVLFAGVEALASRHSVSPLEVSLAGAVIPRHDPNCSGSGASVASEACQADRAAIDRAEADAYSDW
jgi:hypothetical protein